MSEEHKIRREWRVFRAGEVAHDIFALFFRNFAAIMGVTIIVFLPTLVYSVYAIRRILTEGIDHLQEFNAAPLVVSLLQLLIIQPLANAVLCLALFHALRERPITFGDSALAGLRRLPATLGVILLQMLAYAAVAIGIGLACVVVGLVAALVSQTFAAVMVGITAVVGAVVCIWIVIMLYVAVPAVVVEGISPSQAMQRSAALTKNLRWRVSLVLAIVGLVALGFGILSGAFQVWLVFQDPVQAAWVGVVSQEILTLVMTALGAVAMVVCYFHLRCAKEGLDVETMTSAFDEEGIVP